MDSSNLINSGLTLMLIGMGFVFVFLTLLVLATKAMSFLITKYEKSVGVLPEEGVPSPTAVIPHVGPSGPSHVEPDDKTLISILSAAIHKYRSHHK